MPNKNLQKIEIKNIFPEDHVRREARHEERKRYIRCFIDGADHCADDWGGRAGIHELITKLNIKTVCDVGCGIGNFLYKCVSDLGVTKAYGIDPASITISQLIKDGIIDNTPGANQNGNMQIHELIDYHEGDACYIPLPDKCVDAYTSFDCWEHILPEDIDESILNAKRIAKKYVILSISLISSKSYDGKNNHPTVWNRGNWLHKLNQNFSQVDVLPYTRGGKTVTVLCHV